MEDVPLAQLATRQAAPNPLAPRPFVFTQARAQPIPRQEESTATQGTTAPPGHANAKTQTRNVAPKARITDIATIVKRLRITVPVMKMLKLDKGMRQLILTQLIA